MTVVRATSGPLSVEVDPARGARLVSFVAHGHELLSMQDVPGVTDSVAHGCYPMVPWAGRVRDGLLVHADGTARLPTSPDGHALHGLGRDAAWDQVGELTFRTRLGEPWPVEATATLTYELTGERLTARLEWDGDGPGASLGFHPWWRRVLASGAVAQLALPTDRQVERGADGLPTGRLVDPAPGPWDDCFSLTGSPVITWAGAVRATLGSDADWWVVFTEPDHAVCVEPQTAPPDAWNHPDWHGHLAHRSVTLTVDVEPA